MAKNTGLLIGGALAIGAILVISSKGSKTSRPTSTGSTNKPSSGIPSWMVDRRGDADPASYDPRKVMDPYGVTLHQMSVSRSADPDRLLAVHAHFVVMRDGRVLWLHDLDRDVHNSQYNQHVQIEVEGNFQSHRGKWNKGDKYHHLLLPEQAAALRKLMVWLEQRIRKNEEGFYELTSHSMAAAPVRRFRDSGPEIWTAVGNWALNRDWALGPVISPGVPIADEWWDYTPGPLPGANA